MKVSFLLGLLSLLAPAVARADTLYSVSGSFGPSGALPFSGTFTLNSSNIVSAAAISVAGNPLTLLGPSETDAHITLTDGYKAQLDLYSTGGASPVLCTTANTPALCAGHVTQYISPGSPGGVFAVTGAITAPTASATPEPSGFILLGTGALTLAGAIRRRLLVA